jgi:hypothetical protein
MLMVAATIIRRESCVRFRVRYAPVFEQARRMNRLIMMGMTELTKPRGPNLNTSQLVEYLRQAKHWCAV